MIWTLMLKESFPMDYISMLYYSYMSAYDNSIEVCNQEWTTDCRKYDY